ncbi:MAG TPA: AraC family transcriptional regulator [Devosia sp.]|nr:AraC family transcriptional regulator [Devosia sp.]
MKPLLEKVAPPDGASWSWLDRQLHDAIPFQWHHHAEFELTLTLNSAGQRFIGDHIGDYGDGDLVLIGPNLPHTWASREKLDETRPHRALVMWFSAQWAAPLVEGMIEMRAVGDMLARAKAGLQFSPAAAKKARPVIEGLFRSRGEDRLVGLLIVLTLLARDRGAVPLSTPTTPEESSDRDRIDRVLDHIHTHYAGGLSIGGLADIAALSPSGLHRLFRRHTQQTVSAYVMRLRIGEACVLLSDTALPIANIAADVGYGALANFNRQFRALKGMTPREWRQQFSGGRRWPRHPN